MSPSLCHRLTNQIILFNHCTQRTQYNSIQDLYMYLFARLGALPINQLVREKVKPWICKYDKDLKHDKDHHQEGVDAVGHVVAGTTRSLGAKLETFTRVIDTSVNYFSR